MSEAAKFSSHNIKGWLEKETSSMFVPIHTKAQRLRDDMRRALDNLTESSKMLLDNSAKEIEKRNMKTHSRARALNKLSRIFVDRMKQIKIPETVSYESLHDFDQKTQQALVVTEVDIRNWFPRISPFFILDRRKFLTAFAKAQLSFKEMNDFTAKEYLKTKTLEDTYQLADRLAVLEHQLAGLKEQKAKALEARTAVERDITEKKLKITDLKSKGGLGELNQIDAEIEVLKSEVKQTLQHLQKPFVKFQALSLHGGGSGLTQDELEKLGQYLENPFEVFASEEVDYPILIQILQKLKRAMLEEKLNLKPEKERKAEQALENLLKQKALANLHGRCTDAMRRRKAISQSEELQVTSHSLSKLRVQIEDQERKRGIVEGEEIALERAIKETTEKMRNSKTAIERNVLDFLNKRIIIE